jgi:hypothetical protein
MEAVSTTGRLGRDRKIKNQMGITLMKSGQTHRLQFRNAIIAANASQRGIAFLNFVSNPLAGCAASLSIWASR